jgi:hypothetical protein
MQFRTAVGALLSACLALTVMGQDTSVNTAPYDPSQFSYIGAITRCV